MHERVLVVDDERSIAQALGIRLRAAGYDVQCAFDGFSGLAAAREWRPAAIVLDIRMPDIDGFEVNRRLRAQPELASTPVIFLSANVQESARQAALAAGAQAFLTKPYESGDVLAAVRSALEDREPSGV
ncbi:MAG TPA: response regulator [Planctomycetota bacterium]|nr:response regulator [Planctomycetota bacterium]